MPFQVLPIALRGNTGSPVTKLLWIQIVQEARLTDAPNGRACVEIAPYGASKFAQCAPEEAIAGWEHLERLGLIAIVMRHPEDHSDDWFLDVNLPMSPLSAGERRRIKATPDQIDRLVALASYRCAGCGDENISNEGWHVDHIIPRSIGGADVEENCQVLCEVCNSRKGARVHWIDFLGRRG